MNRKWNPNSEKCQRVVGVFAKSLPMAAMALAVVLAFDGDAAAQTSCTNLSGPPGLAYPLRDWRLIDDGDLPQTYAWAGNGDALQIQVDDGASMNLGPNEMQITLVTSLRSQKEISGWNSFSGYMPSKFIATPGPFDGQITPPDGTWRLSMRIMKGTCSETANTIVFLKAEFLGILQPVYYLDPNNFWTLWGGKSVMFTWISDAAINTPYPPECSSPCVPLGRLAPVTLEKKLVGDFDGDFKSDIALTGVAGWNTLPVAFSNGDGTFRVTDSFVGDFGSWASQPGVKALVGHFNDDNKADIVLIGGAGWGTLPLAFSNGDGTFRVTNSADCVKPSRLGCLVLTPSVHDFAVWAQSPKVKVLVGDFNHDGLTDIALTGVAGWNTLPVAFSNGDGTFRVTNLAIGAYASWASQPGVKAFVGDFNNDGYADMALVGGAGWNTLPVAFSNGDGTFRVTNSFVGDFAAWAASAGKKLVGDFNNDGKTDIALIGGIGWSTLPVAFSNGDGTFSITNRDVGLTTIDVPRWVLEAVVGDFDGDHKADIAMFHPNPIAGLAWMFRSNGDGSFEPRISCVGYFGGAANALYATKLVGDFNNDGKADVALTGMAGWSTLPVALGNARSSWVGPASCYQDFALRNFPIDRFAGWAAQ